MRDILCEQELKIKISPVQLIHLPFKKFIDKYENIIFIKNNQFGGKSKK